MPRRTWGEQGLTLIELLLGGMTLAITAAAILGAYLGQLTLNEHARNLALAVHDANRVIEQIRQDNSPCLGTPPTLDIIPPGAASWNAWMNTGGQGAPKSLQPDPDTNERIVVTCQSSDGAFYCPATQMGTEEWHAAGAATQDPLRVTVAVCWRHRQRTIGECAWDGANLSASAATAGANNIVDSPAMLTTLVTCRQ